MVVDRRRKKFILVLSVSLVLSAIAFGRDNTFRSSHSRQSWQENGSTPELVDTTLYASTIRFAFTAGITIPTGDFGATGGNKSGYALSGPLFNFDFLFPVYDPFLITSSVSYNTHNTDNDAFRAAEKIPSDVRSILGDWKFLTVLLGVRYEHTVVEYNLYGGISYGGTMMQSASVYIASPSKYFNSDAINAYAKMFRLEFGATAFGGITAAVLYYRSYPTLPGNMLGTPELAQLNNAQIATMKKYAYKQTVSILTFTCGFAF
jgi:hypothetical protein